MSLFNAIYTFGGCRSAQPIDENSKISVELDSQRACARSVRWAKWAVSLPVRFAHGVYNHVSMVINKDINAVFAKQIYSGNSINCLQFLVGKTGHIISSPQAISVITKKFRHDPEGPFGAEKEDTFIPMLKDLFPKEGVDQEDFLFSCSHANVKSYRDPLLNYIGRPALPGLMPEISQVAKEVLDSINGNETISARNLAETYTVAILARLFLNHPGSLADYQKIGRAASFTLEYQFLKKWGKPDASQVSQYGADLQTLRSAIEVSSGGLIDAMKAADLSPIRIKGELLLVYGAGSETTSSAMQYILWRLGQDLELQDKIRNQPETHLEPFINECFKQYTPATFFSRFARQDLVIKVQNRDGETWQYPIAKGEALIVAPHLAGNYIFGGGQHICPGQWLARAEIGSMITALLSRYAVDSFPRKKELATVPGFGFLKVEPVELALRKLS